MEQEKIGRFIAACRREKNMTQEQLAEVLGVTNKSISKWENGNCLPDPSKYKLLCEILGCSINELFSGERLPSENTKEASDHLLDVLVNRIYHADCGITYEEFKNALLRISEAMLLLSAFSSKETAVQYLKNQTDLPYEECAAAYDLYTKFDCQKRSLTPVC